MRHFSTPLNDKEYFARSDDENEDAEAEIVDESSPTPFDDDYFAADRKFLILTFCFNTLYCFLEIEADEAEAILGISQFEEGLRYFHDKKYDQSEILLKEALKILKSAK